jgi:hypothetical protein
MLFYSDMVCFLMGKRVTSVNVAKLTYDVEIFKIDRVSQVFFFFFFIGLQAIAALPHTVSYV